MKKSLFLTSAIMTAVLAVGLSTSTYAWYSTTIGAAVSVKTQLDAAVNNFGEYELETPEISYVYNDAGAAENDEAWLPSAWTKTDSTTGAYDSTATSWNTGVMLTKAGGAATWTHDYSSKGILAAYVTYTIAGYGEASNSGIADQYKVVPTIECTNTITASTYKWAYVVDGVPAAGTYLNGGSNAIETKYDIAAEDVNYKIAIWMDGNAESVNSENPVKDENLEITVLLTIAAK